MSLDTTVIADAEALISNLELPYLKRLQKVLEGEIRKREDTSITDAIVQIQKIAAGVGMKAETLLQMKAKIAPKPAKYRHPTDQKLTWSGYGRKPTWVLDYVKEGSIDDLLVK